MVFSPSEPSLLRASALTIEIQRGLPVATSSVEEPLHTPTNTSNLPSLSGRLAIYSASLQAICYFLHQQ